MCIGMNCDGSPLSVVPIQIAANVINVTGGPSEPMYCEAEACDDEAPPSVVGKLGEAWYCLRHYQAAALASAPATTITAGVIPMTPPV